MSTNEAGAAAPADPRRWLALGILLIANFMNLIDVTIVNVALPSMRDNLGASDAQIEWVVAAYVLAFALGLLPFGRLGDIVGRSRMFLIGVAAFTLASALCGMAPSIEMLIGARVLQGLGGAMMTPQVLAIATVTFPPHERGQAFSLFGLSAGLASVCGPVLGGLLIDAQLFGLDWQPIFLVNIPIGIAAIIAGWFLIPRLPGHAELRNDYAGIALFLFFVLAPFIEGFLVSLKPLAQLFSTPYSFIPENGSFAAYFSMWESVPALGMHIFNSFFISTVVTAIVVAIVVPAAYAFARFNFTGAGLLLAGFLAVNMFSGAVLLIPLFRLMRTLGLLNTYWAMIVPGAAFLIPSSVWLLRTYMMRIPRELDEAAWVDGASRLYTLRRVILPLAMPGVVVVAIMTFIGAYAQQFIFALTFNSKTEFMPLPVGLFAFFGKQEVIWNELMAASFVGILPVMIVIVFLQRYLVAGLTAGAVKQ